MLVSAAGVCFEHLRNETLLRVLEKGVNFAQFVTANVMAQSDWLVRRRRGRLALMWFVAEHPEDIDPALAAEQVKGAGKPGFLPALDALTDYPIRDRLGEIQAPTLVVWGEKDALVSFAPVYRELEEATGDSDLAWIGRKLHLWEVSTAYPLTFRVAVSGADPSEKRRLYNLIYSYLVRRALCGLTPKNLNKTFARLTRQMIANGVS